MTQRKTTLLLISTLILCCLPVTADDPVDSSAPHDIGLREQTAKRLFQLDVTVEGPAEAIESLTRDDFELVVGGDIVPTFSVDRICREPKESVGITIERTEAEQAPAADPGPPRLGPASFLIYFDQPFLTMGGRNEAIRIAKELIPELIVGGNRAVIVSNGEVLTTYSELTGDNPELLAAVDEVAEDPQQWDPFSVTEESRIQDVIKVFRDRGVVEAGGMARQYQMEEQWKTAKALRRFSMVLGRFAELSPPKAVIYFADRMRSRPGLHYQSFFANHQISSSAALGRMTGDGMLSQHNFDRVLAEANANGMRIYTIQAEGMTQLGVAVNLPGNAPAGASTSRHITSAQNSLASMALETGGKAFLNGIPSRKIIRRIQTDLSCLYLLSFDPSGMIEDEPLPVLLRVFRKKVKAQTRGQIIVQSRQAMEHSRLLAAFTAPDLTATSTGAHGTVIPIGYEDGQYEVLVQFAVDGGLLPDTSWDMGVSLLTRGEMRADASARFEMEGPGSLMILEREMTFRPGPFELIMVAREENSRQIASIKLDGAWPDPDKEEITISPITPVQPTRGAFLKAGELKRVGPLGKEQTELLQTDTPTALVSLVCRAKTKKKGKLLIERQVGGDSFASFDPMVVKLGKERCIQIRDVISADTMTEGSFVYEIHVFEDDIEITSKTVTFSAVEREG
jgi:hypothetical protein